MTGVLLLTFGSAVTADDVPAYLASVRGGRPVPAEVIEEFSNRYRRIGRSPLIDITRAQAAALQERLDAGGAQCIVEVGMLHSEPRIAAAVDALVQRGAGEIVAIVLAPQYSPIILAGYERAMATARERHPTVPMRVAGAWHLTPGWIESLALRIQDALDRLEPVLRDRIPIIFTAHSLPRSVVDRDPGYIDQLRETAAAVARRARIPASRWQFAYQSAGHTPEEWLRPDVKELLPQLRDLGHREVLVVPLQFLADHLEILYDIDVAAVEEAAEHGVRLRRIELPNTSPAFIRALAEVVARELPLPAGS
jgi:protoporphyrin/coproporphyrin ferrochelatase